MGSRNNSGANLRVENKIVPVYSNPESQSRCVVSLLDKYISKLPPVALRRMYFTCELNWLLQVTRLIVVRRHSSWEGGTVHNAS